jgi:NADPH-dependent glutamate synthase beta subunit-like oxidoreductase
MESVGQNVEQAKKFILSPRKNPAQPVSDSRFIFRFLSSPCQILGNASGMVTGIELVDTTLQLRADGTTKAVQLETKSGIDTDSVVFSIGDSVDRNFGLPLNEWGEYAKNPEPRYPIRNTSYEAYDPTHKTALDSVFLAGWAREPSSGLVGEARQDGANCAKAVLEYLDSVDHMGKEDTLSNLNRLLASQQKLVIRKQNLAKLAEVEQQRASQNNLDEFKFSTNDEMLQAMGLA